MKCFKLKIVIVVICNLIYICAEYIVGEMSERRVQAQYVFGGELRF